MKVSDIDLRLLRVFRAVVDAGGFANAQAILNVGASTISTQMAHLEARLGYVLCHRGRGGFRLTDKGETLYRLVVEFFSSVHHFEVQAAELTGGLNGQLRIGFLDNIVSDGGSPLRGAVELFRQSANNRVKLLLEVLTPQHLERALLDQRIDVAIGIFYSRLPGLAYEELYRQREVLLCNRCHPLAKIKHEEELLEAVSSVPKVMRSFLGRSEFAQPAGDGEPEILNVSHIEASTLLILTGECIGFLPKHFAQPWIDAGELIELLPDRLYRDSQFSIATLADPSFARSALALFLQCLRRVAQGLRSPEPQLLHSH